MTTPTLEISATAALTNAERLLVDLVALPSPSHHEADAVRHLVAWMDANGYTQSYIDAAGNAVGIIGTGTREIMLLGHIDTFGGNPPVHLDEAGRTLYGRGSVDAKGSLCAFAAAAAQANLPADVRVVVVGAVEEEAASSKGARHIAQTFTPDLCLIGEPSHWERITLGYKGRLVIDWRWQGALGHSAGQTLTPAEHAVAYWLRVQAHVAAINAGRERIFTQLDAALQALNTGDDGVQGWATMTLGFRLPPGIDPAALAATLPKPEAGATVETSAAEVAYLAEKDTPLSRVMRGAIRAEGGKPAFVHKTGTSDMNVVGQVWRCPMIAYGPGDSALDHTPDEHLNLDEYLRAVRVLTDALERL